ncbi:hypothetical protein AVEN_166646-1 [Araneus ventricosus]|uniref:Uncharacterized protein n=1 Tax=Araneus ventricosus TaxID=182803 RepID=A0A4Y2E3G3_ARAVE|nr:hypothetical protein AVEN_166646-1 [Araneus ventricosus]
MLCILLHPMQSKKQARIFLNSHPVHARTQPTRSAVPSFHRTPAASLLCQGPSRNSKVSASCIIPNLISDASAFHDHIWSTNGAERTRSSGDVTSADIGDGERIMAVCQEEVPNGLVLRSR